jgi:SRSO17 transposase
MDWEERSSWSATFDEYMSKFGDLYARSESREKAGMYVRGLLADVERKNSWQLAEKLNLLDPHPIQRLLNEARWDADAVQKRQREQVYGQVNEAGVLVIDESGFIKKGTKSAGVSRQYCGRVGKVENCQMGVYLTYASASGSFFLDRRLYLPKVWCEDSARRQAAAIPDEIQFQSKPQLAQEMLAQVWDEGFAVRYVTGDTLYGNSPRLRNFIADSEHLYVLGIGSQHQVSYDGASQSLKAIAERIPEQQWEKIACRFSEKGLLWYSWTACRIEMKNDTVGHQWLLIRRSLATEPGYGFFVSNAPVDTDLSELVAVASMRHEIEQSFQEAKDQLGLADYEVRTWHGWHRHMTLCFLAHTYLTLFARLEREKKASSSLDQLQSR